MIGMTRQRSALIAAVLVGAASAVACGGGGDSAEQPCSSASALMLQLSWVSNGVATGRWVEGRVNQPLVAEPVIAGLPASCVGKVSFALGVNTLPSGPSSLPAGLTLDANTGRISGTSAAAFGVSGPDFIVHVQGYSATKFIFNISITQ